jgi:very-short-patch-repair endonuclease
MADLLWLSNEVQDRKYHNNQIQCKHLDFVLCDKSGLKPTLVIELDDSSHSRYDRRESDEFKDRVFQMVDLPLLRTPVQDAYSREELKAQIEERMGLKREPIDNAY